MTVDGSNIKKIFRLRNSPFLRRYPQMEPRKTAQRRAFEEKQTPDLTPEGVIRPPQSRPRPALRGGVRWQGTPKRPPAFILL